MCVNTRTPKRSRVCAGVCVSRLVVVLLVVVVVVILERGRGRGCGRRKKEKGKAGERNEFKLSCARLLSLSSCFKRPPLQGRCPAPGAGERSGSGVVCLDESWTRLKSPMRHKTRARTRTCHWLARRTLTESAVGRGLERRREWR